MSRKPPAQPNAKKSQSALSADPQFILPEDAKAKAPRKAKSKAAIVRGFLDKGATKTEIVKKTKIPYPYVWDVEAAWKKSKEAAK